MLSLKNKIVFITGASSGIGEACAKQYAALGANLILTARRFARINDLAKQLSEEHGIKTLPLELDVQDRTAVEQTISQLSTEWQAIDVLVNNAGLALTTDLLQDGDPDNWDTMIDTNIKGVLYVTRAILPFMVKRQSGHIVNISSIAGVEYYPAGNVYSATKHALHALSKSMRLDLQGHGIRVSEICPGAVETEFSIVRWQDKSKADAFYANFQPLVADDIADTVIYCSTRPLHVNVEQLIVLPVAQASANHLLVNNGQSGGIFDK